MTRSCAVAAVLVVLLGGVPTPLVQSASSKHKHLFNADILSSFCNSPHGAPYDDGICAGYIIGIADAILGEPDTAKSLCVPRNLSTADFSKLVTRRLARYPEDARRPAAEVIRAALLTAFACDKP